MNNQLMDSIQTLATLAKEAKMATQNHSDSADHERDLLSEQIRAADYMASLFNCKYRNTTSIQEVSDFHQCMLQCRAHANELKAKLQAILDADAQRAQYLRDSV